MRIGKTEYYALILLDQLKKSERVALPDIAKKHNIPGDFLYKIALKLKHAGIIDSKEGVDGGYFLVKKFKDISLFDILASQRQERHDIYCTCTNTIACSKHNVCEVYSNLNDELNAKLKEITLDIL